MALSAPALIAPCTSATLNRKAGASAMRQKTAKSTSDALVLREHQAFFQTVWHAARLVRGRHADIQLVRARDFGLIISSIGKAA